MAARSQMPVGSSQWISAEKENVLQLLEQEKEEIVFPAQHELEWLNEHMAEIFSKTQFNVTDVFKTPGKMRGKTPRTNRKRNLGETRVPLSDVFATSMTAPPMSSPARAGKPNKHVAQFSIAKDFHAQPELPPEEKPIPPSQQYTDSGYHGSTGDEMDVDEPATADPIKSPQPAPPPPEQQQSIQKPDVLADERRTTEGSFHSAREEMTRKVSYNREQVQQEDAQKEGEDKLKDIVPTPKEPGSPPKSSPKSVPTQIVESAAKAILDEPDFSDLGSPSDGSTPDRPLIRKSSLTFASLPAREPIPTKKSMGNRISRTSQVDQAKARNSHFSRQTGTSRLTQAQPEAPKQIEKGVNDHNGKHINNNETHVGKEDSDPEDRATRMHNKSKTQQLHERIGMLGKSQPSRTSKSIPSTVALANSQVKYPQLHPEKAGTSTTSSRLAALASSTADDEDDWIKPLASPQNGSRPQLVKSHTADVMEHVLSEQAEDRMEIETEPMEPRFIHEPDSPEFQILRKSPSPSRFGHTKSASTISLISPAKAANPLNHKQNISVSNPQHGTTTPAGSPKRLLDGPLSASKSKFQSIMKTAKGLFTSGAGVSAAAKMETMSPNALKLASENMPGLFPSIDSSSIDKALPPPPSPSKEGRKTRSSTEREKEEKKKEKEAKERQRIQDQLDKAREKERHKAAEFQQKQQLKSSASVLSLNKPQQAVRRSPRRAAEESSATKKSSEAAQMPPPAGLTHQPSAPRLNEARRPVKPALQALSKQKEPPRNIRIGMPSQRVPPSNSMFSGLQDTLPPAATKPNTVTKKPSTQSLHTNPSNSSLKSSISSQPGKLKSLTAAAKKKEQDEREARRKEELRQERARAEAEKKERERAEAERKEKERTAAEEARKQAQKQAMERKRQQEQARRLEQQRAQQAANDFSSSTQDRPSVQRNDPGPARAPSRLNNGQILNRSVVNHPLTNAAKPAKRPLEDDVGSSRPQPTRFGTVAAASEAKRRRTEDETPEPTVRPIMAPPQRQSNIKKDQPKSSSIFSHGYTHAPPVAVHHQIPSSQVNGNSAASSSHFSQYPSNPSGHRAMHPMDLAKYTNGKVPFAEAPNPPQTATNASTAAHRTPAPALKPSHHHAPAPKSSPHYPNGENIQLPDIPTDSEDDDSSDSASPFPVPSWAEPDALRSALLSQDAMTIDPDQVFGPVAPLRMEEMFAKGGSKERMKRWKERTSSANWVVSGDGLTVEEVRADREGRERIRGEGGWRFGNGNL